eukprot:15454666-Alexandrium_andersonii.AAC.1
MRPRGSSLLLPGMARSNPEHVNYKLSGTGSHTSPTELSNVWRSRLTSGRRFGCTRIQLQQFFGDFSLALL